MKRFRLLATGVGLCAALLTGAAYAECGLDVDPAALDVDGSGDLSGDETRGTALAAAFSVVDADGDGIISPPEFRGRCVSVEAAQPSAPKKSVWEDTVVGEKVDRQTQRQRSNVNRRVDRETDEAADNLLNKAFDSLFK